MKVLPADCTYEEAGECPRSRHLLSDPQDAYGFTMSPTDTLRRP